MYVSKFEKKLPTEEIGVVIAAARGQATKKEGLSAGLWALGCGAEFLPDDGGLEPRPMVNAAGGMSDEDCAAALEGHLQTHRQMSAAGDEVGAGGMWISILAPLILQLLQGWLKPKAA